MSSNKNKYLKDFKLLDLCKNEGNDINGKWTFEFEDPLG